MFCQTAQRECDSLELVEEMRQVGILNDATSGKVADEELAQRVYETTHFLLNDVREHCDSSRCGVDMTVKVMALRGLVDNAHFISMIRKRRS